MLNIERKMGLTLAAPQLLVFIPAHYAFLQRPGHSQVAFLCHCDLQSAKGTIT